MAKCVFLISHYITLFTTIKLDEITKKVVNWTELRL